ncbi:MAG TPA: ParB N-terminal domain-containing protein [Methanothrix sp.]|nr:ParB N-terminal domain-containing protein [Methanothrix sp.]
MKLAEITLDPDLQPRVAMDHATIAEYAEEMEAGATFPAITVFDDGSQKWLADGWHRYVAAQKAGLEEIDVDLRTGSRRDALLFSISANAKHGLRRSRDDKRRGVLALLSDPEWSVLSDRELARMAGVTHPTIAKYRAELDSEGGKFTTSEDVGEEFGWPGFWYFIETYGYQSLHFEDYTLDSLPVPPGRFGEVLKKLDAEMLAVSDHLEKYGIIDHSHICGRRLVAVTETDDAGVSYMLNLDPHPSPYRFWMEIFKIDELNETGEAFAFKKPVALDYVGLILALDIGIGNVRLSDFCIWCEEDGEPSYIPPFRDDYEGLFNDWDRGFQDQLEAERRGSE